MEELLKENDLPQQPLPEDAEVPAEPAAPAVEEAPAAEEPAAPERREEPAEEPEEDEDPEEAEAAIYRRIRRKKIFRGALRFYTLLFGGILCVLILLWCLMNPLQTILTQYETSQPRYIADEIYNTLFADPDWALLYDMAGIQPTQFEGRDEYVAYMEAKVGDQKLEYVEIPAGLTGEKCYSVRLAGEEVATFTMEPVDDGVSTFGRWTFGKVEVFFTRQESVAVTMMPGYTVYINGVPLDDSYTTLQVSTVAEDYIPEGLHGYRYMQQKITGLLVQPEVVVLDEYNNPVPLTQDPVTGDYTTPIKDTVSMTWGEKDLVVTALQNQALFAIRAIPMTQLREYFAPGSQAYEAITSTDALAEGWKTYAFDDSATVVKDFYRYSDTLFSVWAEVTVNVADKKGNITSCTVGGTYFFSPNSVGNYMATELYDADLQQLVYQVPEGNQ